MAEAAIEYASLLIGNNLGLSILEYVTEYDLPIFLPEKTLAVWAALKM